MIHQTAIIHPKAKVDPTVRVGPYAVIDDHVELGPDCLVGPHVYLTGQTTIGARNRFFSGCVIGEAPQDLKYKGELTRLRIGDGNTFRENVTVNRSTAPGDETVVGSNNLLMAGAHVAHDCRVGDFVILANGSLLAGHVSVADRALVSGNAVVHQFIRIGTLAMMQGGSAISKDLPPFTVARGVNELCGLNIIGLRRAGFSSQERLELKRVYRMLFRDGMPLRAAQEEARKRFASAPAKIMLDFVAASKRGICADRGRKSGADPEESE